MAISKKQAEFDVEKWLKSESVGHDLCGDFDFCTKCDKSLENPCAAAYDAHSAPAPKKKTAKPAAKQEPAKKPTPEKPTAQKASVKITEKEQTRTTRNKTASKKK